MVLWSTSHFGGGLHGFRTLPWPLRRERIPEHWPEPVGRFWLQAHRSYTYENWDAAAVMARSAVQAVMREQDAHGPNLRAEIDDLADRGILPPHMKEWAHELRELGNESAHPGDDGDQPARSDVRDMVEFLDFLFQYLQPSARDRPVPQTACSEADPKRSGQIAIEGRLMRRGPSPWHYRNEVALLRASRRPRRCGGGLDQTPLRVDGAGGKLDPPDGDLGVRSVDRHLARR